MKKIFSLLFIMYTIIILSVDFSSLEKEIETNENLQNSQEIKEIVKKLEQAKIKFEKALEKFYSQQKIEEKKRKAS